MEASLRSWAVGSSSKLGWEIEAAAEQANRSTNQIHSSLFEVATICGVTRSGLPIPFRIWR